jgi:flagellar protein FliO/FliZ
MALIGITLVLALTYFASKWYAGKMGPFASGKHIKVIDRVMVGKNSSIALIELGGAQYMVGVTEQGVSIMKELENPVEAAPPPLTLESGPTLLKLRGFNFREVLDRYGVRKGGGL